MRGLGYKLAKITFKHELAIFCAVFKFALEQGVIEYTFGPKVPILAGVTVQQTPRRGTQRDMIVDQFLIGAGLPLAISDAAKRYGGAIADP